MTMVKVEEDNANTTITTTTTTTTPTLPPTPTPTSDLTPTPTLTDNITPIIPTLTTATITTTDTCTIPPGNYKLVGWDMNITGKKPTDEICQIACYTPYNQYSQYVMPYKDLTRFAKLRFALKVITITKFRMLKDTKSNKIVKSKSEVSALTEFINWLKTVREYSDGIILVYHEFRQILPAILLESLQKHDHLYNEFKSYVKGFVNSCDIAKANTKDTSKFFAMRTLARNFFNKSLEEYELANAAVRAKLALEIIEYFINTVSDDKLPKNIITVEPSSLYEFIYSYIHTIEEEETIHAELKAMVKREISLTPIFATLLRSSKERQQATPLRRLLAEAEIEYNQLEQVWKEDQKNGVIKLINEKLNTASPKYRQKLIHILECYFDEEKAEELKLELEKKPKTLKKKKRYIKKVDTTINIDSGNDSGDNTLTQSPTKLEVSDSNENQIELSVSHFG